MNRSEIRALVEQTTGRSDKTTVINSAINTALNKISAAHLWSELLTVGTGSLTVDAESFTLDSTLQRLTRFRILDSLLSYPLTIVNESWVLSQFPDPSAFGSGKPRFGWLRGKVLHLLPVPDSTYNVSYTYFRKHPGLDSDDAEVLISCADDAVIAYTTYWLFRSIEKHEDANQWFADYQMHLRDAKEMDRSSAVMMGAQTRGMKSYLPEIAWLDPFIHTFPGPNS
jgi:hypothetical protein